MLILGRKLHEKILIGDDIVVQVVSIEKGKVRLGVTAPPDLPVDRKEVRTSKLANPKKHCQKCNGTGRIKDFHVTTRDMTEGVQDWYECEDCNGSGEKTNA